MSEIEKMYKNAGIKKRRYCEFDDDACIGCKHIEKVEYPPFTSEKQLLLIQWLAETRPIHITLLLGEWTIEGMVRYGIKYDTFEDALSGYVNQIWKDLTPEEKQQVKGILE